MTLRSLLLFVPFVAACSGTKGEAATAAGDDGGASALPADAGVDGSLGPDAGAASFDPCPGGVPAPYPTSGAKPALGEPLPDAELASSIDGKVVALHDSYAPCAPDARLLVLRIGASWAGTWRWHAAHTGELRAALPKGRVTLVDILVRNDDNAKATASDLASARARIDEPDMVAVDPDGRFVGLGPVRAPLPNYVVVDARTMTVLSVLGDPSLAYLEYRLARHLAELDGAPPPPPPADPLEDGRFTREEWDLLQGMTLPGAPPPDPTNAKADDPGASALGQKLFFDTTLSPSNRVSCATCHDPQKAFGDGLPHSEGVAKGERNAPNIALASHNRWQFWDGRADTLWMQATGPFENATEFGSSRLFVAHAIYDRYRSAYEGVFGALPEALAEAGRWPASGKPGDSAYDALSPDDRTAITRVFANVAKAIAAYERTLRVPATPFDAYVQGRRDALDDRQKDSLLEFFHAGCAQCHYGPRLTDDAFHNVRFPTGRLDGAADRGRIDGIAPLLASEFRGDGLFSDDQSQSHGAPVSAGSTNDAWLGAFKTPSLRGVASSAPYGHGGSLATLADVVRNYGSAGLPPESTLAVGESEPWVLRFSAEHEAPLVTFLSLFTLTPTP